MKTVNAIKIIEEMRNLESARQEYLEHYEVPQRENFLISFRKQEDAEAAFQRETNNHKTLVDNAKDRVDALTLALYALGVVRTS